MKILKDKSQAEFKQIIITVTAYFWKGDTPKQIYLTFNHSSKDRLRNCEANSRIDLYFCLSRLGNEFVPN